MTISNWIRIIQKRWEEQRVKDFDQQKTIRVKQIEAVAVAALNDYERSRQDEEEFTITRRGCEECRGTGEKRQRCELCKKGKEEFMAGKFRVCLKCHGEGYLVIENCSVCQGTGKVTVEMRKVRGKTGDPSYLTVAKACFEACAKLEGLYPAGTIGRISKEIITEAKLVGGETQRTLESFWYEAPIDLIIKSKAVLEEFRAGVKTGEVKRIEAMVFETKAEEADGDVSRFRENEGEETE